MFFSLFKKRSQIKKERNQIYVCKHCKFSCNGCNMLFCYSCHVNVANPCPKCGKRNIDYTNS